MQLDEVIKRIDANRHAWATMRRKRREQQETEGFIPECDKGSDHWHMAVGSRLNALEFALRVLRGEETAWEDETSEQWANR